MVRGNLAPGVYIEEIPVHPIAGVPTSITAFVGAAAKGPVTGPLLVTSFVEFATQYDGLTVGMPLGYAVQQYFDNGGSHALIARVEGRGSQLADADLSDPALEKKQRGLWLLDQAERVDILCIPPLTPSTDVGKVTWDAAAAYASKRRAFVIVDPPAVWANAQAGIMAIKGELTAHGSMTWIKLAYLIEPIFPGAELGRSIAELYWNSTLTIGEPY